MIDGCTSIYCCAQIFFARDPGIAWGSFCVWSGLKPQSASGGHEDKRLRVGPVVCPRPTDLAAAELQLSSPAFSFPTCHLFSPSIAEDAVSVISIWNAGALGRRYDASGRPRPSP